MKRQSGVLLPVFSLPGPYGCGTFGEGAYRWIEKLSSAGFSWWQILPINGTDSANSPYMTDSSYGGNPLFIDPDILFQDGLITKEERDAQLVENPYLCDYENLLKNRTTLLKTASRRFGRSKQKDLFLDAHPHLKETCRFLALKEKNASRYWADWTETQPDEEDLLYFEFVQYQFHLQWEALHNYAREQGVRILGDLPFYVAPNSYDVWHDRDEFLLDARNRPSAVAGVPPDYFSETGQLWGNPLYDWKKMEQSGFRFWKERMQNALDLFDGVRIDHFRAASEFWAIPAGSDSAKCGSWQKGPGKKLIDAFSTLSGESLIFAEDLGVIDQKTRDLLTYSTYPGMSVFQFGFDGNPDNIHLPHNYPENRIAYTGTHDNNTFLGFLMEADERTRALCLDYLGKPYDACDMVIRVLMMSRAGLTIFPAQDLLHYGADTRVNTPGLAEGNWRYRLTHEQMEQIDDVYYRSLNKLYGRLQ